MFTRSHIARTHHDGVVVVSLHGEFDLATADQVRSELLSALEQSDRLVLDLVETLFLDSTALGAIVGAARRAGETGGWLRMAGARPNIHRILRITELETVLGLYGTVEEAIDVDRSTEVPLVG